LPRTSIRCELQIDDRAKLLAQHRVLDRRHYFDPALQVSLHRVRRADEILLGATIAEVIDASVLEKSSYDADHSDVVREARDSGAQPAGIAYYQVDLYPGPRGAIQRARHIDVLECVHLELNRSRR